MGLRDRFRKEDDDLDAPEGGDVVEETVRVGEVAITVGEVQPDLTYHPADEVPEALAAQPPAPLPPPEVYDEAAPAAATAAPVPPASAPAPPPTPAAAQPDREALVRPRLAPWQAAALGGNKEIDEDKLFEEAGLGRFERKSAPHLQTNVHAAPPATASAPPVPQPTIVVEPPAEPAIAPAPAPAPPPAVAEVPAVESETQTETETETETETAAEPDNDAAALEVDLTVDDDDDDESSDRALARRASKLLERGNLSPDDPEVIQLLEVVNSSGLRARPGELVNLNALDPGQRRRLIIRVLCGLVAEVPVDDAQADGSADAVEPATEAASA
jgi:hypothetical protein